MQAQEMIWFISFLTVFFFLSSLCPPPSAQAQQPLLSPIQKDNLTKLYTLSAYLKTPLQLTHLQLDLGASESLTWVDCTSGFESSTFRHLIYTDPVCLEIDYPVLIYSTGNCSNNPDPTCFDGSCDTNAQNPVTLEHILGDILLDSLALPSTNGKNPGKLMLDADYVFSCGNTSLLNGMATGVAGIAMLGRFNFSLPAQLSRAFSSPSLFAICLPSSSSGTGLAIFNSYGPYFFSPGIDLSKSLTYTPLLLNPFGGVIQPYVRASYQYFIGVTGIRVNGRSVPLNKTLLEIDQKDGTGGTTISTATPYGILQTSIFKALKTAFKEAAVSLKLKTSTPVKPFSLCYKAGTVPSTRQGPAVPTIDLVLQSESVIWRISGANSMVNVGGNALCLGFLDGGRNPKTSIVIGGLQIEDNLLQFDMVSQRLGFSSSVLSQSTTCSNFNFTTNNL
ncbi:OLC1v1007356C1 [Oldenlandia corymbosa var. corymbosa]|uniref:OLC1v1007356C1 n=1 Tax=Oldenlandia corymbosa var. corymbosa TaxID=529605 RepID=A0AAV1DM74_OLDCO|nr:OLC1v1007356C1 [Oldenlandia corymbosa var. corymbosa]